MIIILLKDVKGTGKAGEVAKVSDGYARNLLIPKGFAMDIAEALKEQHNIDIEKKKFLMSNPIKTAGETTVEIKIFHEVVATLKVGINV